MQRFQIILYVLLIAVCSPLSAKSLLSVEFSPDGRTLAVIRPDPAVGYKLDLLNISAEVPTKTLVLAESISCVRFSPDGQQICIAACGVKDAASLKSNGKSLGDDLYIVELDGSQPLRITYSGGSSPVYSATGDAVAYIGPNGVLAKIGTDGTGWRILMRCSPVKNIFRWLEDGKSFETIDISKGYLARYAFTPPARHHLVRVSPKHATGKNAICPQISPDGKRIAYITHPAVSDGTSVIRVYIQEHDKATLLGECKEDRITEDKPGLAWSQDGSALAISAGSVWILDAKTGSVRRIEEGE